MGEMFSSSSCVAVVATVGFYVLVAFFNVNCRNKLFIWSENTTILSFLCDFSVSHLITPWLLHLFGFHFFPNNSTPKILCQSMQTKIAHNTL